MDGSVDGFLEWATARDLLDVASFVTYLLFVRAVVGEFVRPVLRVCGHIVCQSLNQSAGTQASPIPPSDVPSTDLSSCYDSGEAQDGRPSMRDNREDRS